MKEGGGAWKVVKEEVVEIGCESVGVVGVREALVKNKQKQDLSHTDHQQQGVVAVRNYLTEPKDDKKDDDDLIRRPSSGIVGVRGYMAWDQGNLCNSLNEGVKASTDENVKEVDGEWRIAMNQQEPPQKLQFKSNSSSCGIVGVKDSMASADKSTNMLANEGNEVVEGEWKVVEAKMEEIQPKGIGIVGVKKALVEPKEKHFSIESWQEIVGILGVKNFMISGEMNYPDDQKEKSMDLGMIKDIQNVESNERHKIDSHGDIVTSENIRSHLDYKSVIKNLKETSKNTSERDKDTRETTIDTRETSKDTRETSKDTRETDKELSTFVSKTYIELVSINNDNEKNIHTAEELDSYVDDKQQEISSQDGADDDDKQQELSSQNEGHETLAEQSETSLGQPLTATGAKGTKYTMSFLTKGRRFSGDKKKLSN